jgi:hypothetical protein
MKLDPDSKYEWRRPRGDLHPRYERVNDAFDKLFARGSLASNVDKRELFENGVEGRAEILAAPRKRRVDSRRENLGRFKAKIEVPEHEPYEVKIKQSFWKDEWERLQPGASVACCVDPEDAKRVLLVTPEPPSVVAAGPAT